MLELIARGLDNHQIAAALRMSAKTLGKHITHIVAKAELAARQTCAPSRR